MNILIVEDEEDIKDIFIFTLDSKVDATYLYASSANEAISLIESENNIDLIICDYFMPGRNGGAVYKYLLEKGLKIPFVLSSSDMPDEHEEFQDRSLFLGFIQKPHIFDGVSSILTSYETLHSNDSESPLSPVVRNQSNYSSIGIGLFNLIPKLPCDIYIKINEHKIIKVFSAHDTVDEESISKLMAKNVSKLFVLRQDAKGFFDALSSKVISILKDESKEEQERVLDVHTIIMDTVSSLGLSPQVIKATEASVRYTIDLFNKQKGLQKIYQKIFSHRGTYLTKHSIVLAYINCGILQHTPWDTFENRNKLVISSFFHDASIKDPDFDEMKSQDTEEGIKTFKDHPAEVAAFIREYKEIPVDVEKIILLHHEQPDGSGLKGIDASGIPPLPSVFIFSHHIVDAIFNLQSKDIKLTKANLAKTMDKDFYGTNHFKKLYDVMVKKDLFG